MLGAFSARSSRLRTLVLLHSRLELLCPPRVVEHPSNATNRFIAVDRWFGTSEVGKASIDKERTLFEEYVKQHRISSLADTMKKEMYQEELEDEQSHVPIRASGFEYSFECPGEFPILYRTPCADDGHKETERELVVDTSELCAMVHQKQYIEMQAMKISRQGDRLLLLAQVDGVSRVFIQDMNNKGKAVLQEHIHDAMDIEYDIDGNIYFTCPDELGRPSKVYCTTAMKHTRGERPTPRLVFEDTNRKHFVGIQRTKDWSYLCINSVSKQSSEVYIIDPGAGNAVLVRPREPHCQYVVEHAHGHLIILSNHDHVLENQLYVAKISHKQDCLCIEPWKPVPYRLAREDGFLSDVTVHARACTLIEKLPTGLPRIRVLPFQHLPGNEISLDTHYDIPLPEWVLDVQFGSNEEYMSDRVELELQSPILPPIHLEWDLKTREVYSKSSLDHAEIKLQQYTAIRIPLQSTEGHDIPLTLAYRNDAVNPSKCLFIVYGAYGENLDMSYQSHIFPLLHRGWKIIYVHVRGGGEKGKAWYYAGRVPHKVNSESDLYECITQLTAKGTTSMKSIS